MENFTCTICKESKPVQTNGGTGYAGELSSPICYACCGKLDRQSMIETGEAILYLTTSKGMGSVSAGTFGEFSAKVGNWPNTLSFNCSVRKGRHNIAGSRYDVWFTGPDGRQWHGVQFGENTQICRCKRTKYGSK